MVLRCEWRERISQIVAASNGPPRTPCRTCCGTQAPANRVSNRRNAGMLSNGLQIGRASLGNRAEFGLEHFRLRFPSSWTSVYSRFVQLAEWSPEQIR